MFTPCEGGNLIWDKMETTCREKISACHWTAMTHPSRPFLILIKKLPFTGNIPQNKNSLFSSRCLKNPKLPSNMHTFVNPHNLVQKKDSQTQKNDAWSILTEKKAKEWSKMPSRTEIHVVSLPYLSNCKSLSDNLNPFLCLHPQRTNSKVPLLFPYDSFSKMKDPLM